MATFVINERTYNLTAVDKLSFSDQRKLKRLTDGMSLQEIMEGVGKGDVDACFGVIMLSAQKENPKFSEEDLNDVNMMDVLNSITSGDEDDAVPPPAVTPDASAPDPSGDATTPADTPGTPSTPGSSA